MLRGLRQLWRGDLPLAKAFWGWAAVGGVVVNGVTTGLFIALLSQDLPVLSLLVGYGLSVPYNVVALVGVWRSADRHPGGRLLAEVARYAAAVGLAVLSVT